MDVPHKMCFALVSVPVTVQCSSPPLVPPFLAFTFFASASSSSRQSMSYSREQLHKKGGIRKYHQTLPGNNKNWRLNWHSSSIGKMLSSCVAAAPAPAVLKVFYEEHSQVNRCIIQCNLALNTLNMCHLAKPERFFINTHRHSSKDALGICRDLSAITS